MNEHMIKASCPIWGTEAEIFREDGHRPFDTLVQNSPRAGGGYWIPKNISVSGKCDEKTKARLTSWLIEQRQLGVEHPEITEQSIKDAQQRNSLSISKRADRLLKYVQTKLPNIGDYFAYFPSSTPEKIPNPDEFPNLDPKTFPNMLAWSESIKVSDVEFLMAELKRAGWIVIDSTVGTSHPGFPYKITMSGYAHLDELENTVVVSFQAFVAMWIDKRMDNVWKKGIEPGIKDSGYRPLRIDTKEHSNKIDDEIVAEIKRSRFVVADFTHGNEGPRGGVYYEAGFAHGLNVPVIFTCRKDAFEKIHFDTRQYNHIVWEKPEDLRRDLKLRIAAVIGDGPENNTNA